VAGQSFGRSPEAALRDSQTALTPPSRPRADDSAGAPTRPITGMCAQRGTAQKTDDTVRLHTRQDVADGSESMASESSIKVFTAEERPELWELARSLFEGKWPEYNHHGNYTGDTSAL